MTTSSHTPAVIDRLTPSVGPLEADYRAATPESERIDGRACRVMPGGDTRVAGFWLPYPITMTGGSGAHMTDVDGRRYLDLAGNYTSLVHGHAYPPIVEAVEEQVRRGTAWPARCEASVELAELIVDRVDAIDRVRFTNSGTEATMLALQIACHVTGRSKVLMARHGYHGSHDAFEAGAWGTGGPRTVLAEYGDATSFRAALEAHGPEIAAVFLEPVAGAGGLIPAPDGFLAEVCEASRTAGALFVCDEVITFRLATGGAQSDQGVTPDLTALGKLIGGGVAVGAVGGRADIMEVTDPRRLGVLASGTYNGNPLTCAAGVAAVRHLTGERIDEMGRLAARLGAGLEQAAQEQGVALSTTRAGSLVNVYLLDEAPSSPGLLDRADLGVITLFHLAALLEGVLFPARGLMAVSSVMDESDIDEAIDRCARALHRLRRCADTDA